MKVRVRNRADRTIYGGFPTYKETRGNKIGTWASEGEFSVDHQPGVSWEDTEQAVADYLRAHEAERIALLSGLIEELEVEL